MMDPIANGLVNLKNCEAIGKQSCTITPASKVLGSILKIIQKEGYIGSFKMEDNGRGGTYVVELLGKINDCRAIRPSYAIKNSEYTYWEKRFLPAKNMGTIILSTNQGVITLNDAKSANIGGRLMAFIY